MRRAHLAVGRIPPGKESFIYHFHRLQEEFLFILSGSGTAEIGEESFAVGPGDYMGFPIDGLGHHLINSGDGDLVYLMGGERSDTEVADFPRIGKRMIVEGDKITLFDCEDAESFQLSEWIGEAEDQA